MRSEGSPCSPLAPRPSPLHTMHFPFTTEPATFLERPNRYVVVARLHHSGDTVRAHCPDPGRLRELLIPQAGVTVHVSHSAVEGRKTAYDLRFVEHPETGMLISLDTRVPNALVAEALQQRSLPPFAALTGIQREVSVPFVDGGIRSRIDFRGTDPSGAACWIEVKSVTLVEDGVALFPDAVTARGRRHLLELIELVKRGDRAAVLFVVQRPDAGHVAAHRSNDPAFAAALDAAHAAGVELHAWRVMISRAGNFRPANPGDHGCRRAFRATSRRSRRA